jgi:arsenate reductase
MDKKKVLFLCTGNSARSQMAEALLRKFAGNRFEVFSAGIEPHGVNPYTIRVLAEKDIDTTPLSSKSIDVYQGKMNFDYLITVCSNAEERCPYYPGVGTRIHWPFEDPDAANGSDEQKINKFRVIRDQIEDRILEWIK